MKGKDSELDGRRDREGTMNDELQTTVCQFIVPSSAFIVCLPPSGITLPGLSRIKLKACLFFGNKARAGGV